MRDSIVPGRSTLRMIVVLCLLFLVVAAAVRFLLGRIVVPSPYAILSAAEIGDLDRLKALLERTPYLVNAAEYGETALHKAANKDIAQVLIAAGADVDANECGWMPLHSAKNRGVAEVLVAAGADVNAKDSAGRTPLHTTSSKDVAEFLIGKGADINGKDDDGETPLRSAIERSHKDVAEFLVAKGADVDIFSAAALGLTEKVKELVGQDINLVHVTEQNGSTPLQIAAAWGQQEVVDLLLASGSHVNAVDKKHKTALHRAVETGHHSLAKLLISRGATVDIFLASALGLSDTVGGFLKADPQLIRARDEWGEEPLHKAAEWGRMEVVKLLITKGADVVRKSQNEAWSPLFWALRGAHYDVAELLIREGASVESRDSYDWTPLQWASEKGREDVVEFLIANGADINAESPLHRWTALHFAAEQGHTDIVKLLIKAGAKPNAKDSFGRTALDIALKRGRNGTAEVLRQHPGK